MNLRVSRANNKRSRSGIAQHHVHESPFLLFGSLAGLGEISLVVGSAAGTVVPAGVCGGNRLDWRSKMI